MQPEFRSRSRRTAVVVDLRDVPLRKRLAFALGAMLATGLPSRAKEIECGSRASSMKLTDRLIRNYLRARAIVRRDHQKIRDMFSKYWMSEASSFGVKYAYRFREQFLKHDAELIDHIAEWEGTAAIREIYELGCGNGQVLNYLAERMKNIDVLTGIDIDDKQVAANQKYYENPRLRFVAEDAVSWIRENGRPSSLIVTNGGVLEYFLQGEVQELFVTAMRRRMAGVAVIETIGSDHDLERDPLTHVYGPELSFSHNYPLLLREAGFVIKHQSERVSDVGGRWIRIFATATSN